MTAFPWLDDWSPWTGEPLEIPRTDFARLRDHLPQTVHHVPHGEVTSWPVRVVDDPPLPYGEAIGRGLAKKRQRRLNQGPRGRYGHSHG